MDPPLPTIRAMLESTLDRWLSLTATAPDDLLRLPPAEGEWSALACLRHLRDTERDVFAVRLRAFLAGENLVPYDPSAQGSRDEGEAAAALARDFARLRRENLAVLTDLAAADLERTVIHGEHGPVRLGEQLHHWAAHDLVHTIQAERALLQPFIARTGPWRATLAEHDGAALGG